MMMYCRGLAAPGRRLTRTVGGNFVSALDSFRPSGDSRNKSDVSYLEIVGSLLLGLVSCRMRQTGSFATWFFTSCFPTILSEFLVVKIANGSYPHFRHCLSRSCVNCHHLKSTSS